jgi:ribose-phosphate pyrophosphokinase
MVRGIVVLGGNSHPQLTGNICAILGIPQCNRILSKFSGGESRYDQRSSPGRLGKLTCSRCEIQDSVRGKDVYIIQTGSGHVNDHLIELCIMISACKIGSAKRITAVLPLFPYSRQPDVPYKKAGAPHSQRVGSSRDSYTDSIPPTPATNGPETSPLNSIPTTNGVAINGVNGIAKKLSQSTLTEKPPINRVVSGSSYVQSRGYTTHDVENQNNVNSFTARPGYKQWIAQAGTLVADLLTCSGADHGS